MKKILRFLLVILSIFVVSVGTVSCNKQLLDFDLSFPHAYVKIGDEWVDLEISTWKDYDGEQLQLRLKDGSILLVSSINCILYKGNLPKN